MTFQIKRPPGENRGGHTQNRSLPSSPRDLANPALLTKHQCGFLGTDLWQQYNILILDCSEHIRQTVVRSVSQWWDQLISLWDGERPEDLQRSLSGEPAGYLVGLELEWADEPNKRQHGSSTSTPKNINTSLQVQVIQLNSLCQELLG